MATNGAGAPDWRDIVERLVKAERDVGEWRAGLAAAEKEQAELQAQLEKALGRGGRAAQLVAHAMNGGRHKPAHAPPPPVKEPLTHDYQRRHRALELVKERGGFLTVPEFAKADQCPREVASGVLWRLAKEGVLHRVARGRYALGPQPKGQPS